MVGMGVFDKPKKRVRVHVFLDEKHHALIRLLAQANNVTASDVHRKALDLGLLELHTTLQRENQPLRMLTGATPRRW